jgi:SNF2 family DNA or RNA helicase
MKYRPRTTPDDHQIAAIAACRAKPPAPCPTDAFAYLMDMGTGKSKVTLDEWGENAVNGGPMDMLLWAPAGSYRNWFADKGEDPEFWSEIRKHLDPALLERTVIHGWRGGKSAGEKNDLRQFLSLQDKRMARILVVNLEAMSTVERAQDLCREFLGQREVHCVIDESTGIKSPRSSRTKVCIDLGQMAASRRILSGLWTPKGPLDLFAQCSFLDTRILGQSNYFAFQRRYAQMVRREAGGRKFWQVVGYQNIEDLQQRVAKYSYRVLLEDCVKMEGKSYDTRGVELTKEQRRMIQEIKLFGNASIGDTGRFVTTDMVIKQIARISQIACGYVMDDEERVLHEVPENRTDALMSLIAETSEKVIVWCPWKPPLKKIVDRLRVEYGPRSVAEWHGGNKATRHEDEQRFLNDPECRFMCATQGAGMRGNTWINAPLAVYYANNYDLEQRDQSERRNYRRGQKMPVRYLDLIAEGTNDIKVVKNLRQKIDLATMINREGYRDWLI